MGGPLGAASDDEEEKKHERVMALPQLQSLMKKDPEAYQTEFDQQWAHFESMLEMFKLKPQKPQYSFSEQVMFLAHVCPSFPEKGQKLPDTLIGALNDHDEIMHPVMRSTLVQALILLRNRAQFSCIHALPLYFKLFRLPDKGLRNMIFTHIVRDVAQTNMRSKHQKKTNELVDFLFAKLKETDVEVARRSCAIFISLNRQNIWKDAKIINLMSAGLMHPDLKISAALAHLFLGNKTKGLVGILEDSDSESEEEEAAQGFMDTARKGIVGSKKTANRKKRVARAKKAATKAVGKRRKQEHEDGQVNFLAIDLLHDPQTLAERLHGRIAKGGEPFLYRLLILHLIARIVGRNQLQLLNLYPYLMKYLQPTQKDVTKVMACFVEACHAQVPPSELRPSIVHIIQTFITEAQAPEVIEVGLNTIREVCVRSVNILEEEELTDLTEFRKFKHKGVAMAARSLINAYRELHPALLIRALRGKEAIMAMTRGELQAPVYGAGNVAEQIDGLELLAEKRNDGEEGGGISAKQMMQEQVLSTEDLQKLRKLKLQKSIELQLGRKRKAEEMSMSGSDSDSDKGGDDDSDEAERGLSGRLPDAMSAEMLRGRKAKPRSKEARVAAAASDFDIKAQIKEKAANRKGGKTNKENARSKPMLMVMAGKKAQRKTNKKASEKMANLKGHIKTLKQKCKTKRRRC